MLRGGAGTPPRENPAAGRRRPVAPLAGSALALVLGCALAAPAAAQPRDAAKRSFAFTGRFHWDAAVYRRGEDAGAGSRETRTLLRRARLGARGAVGRFSYLFVVDADADRGGPAGGVEIEDAAVHYSPSDRVRLGVGRMKIPVTFEESASSNDIALIERALPVDAFTDETLGPRVTNAQVWIYGRNHLVEAAVHLARDAGGAPDAAGARARTIGVTGRAVFAPMRTATSALHLGGWVDRSRGPVGEALWGYGAELDVAHIPALTGRRADGSLQAPVHGGLEAAWLDGPLWVQTELLGGRFRRADGGGYAAGGWYAQVGYVAGGARRYDMREGAWSGAAVTDGVAAGGLGAMELAIRYSTVDFGQPVNPTALRPAGDTGHAGRQSNVTVGVNWYLTGRSRVMVNAIHVDLDEAFARRRGSGAGAPAPTAAPVTGTFWIYGARWQYNW